MSAELEEAVCGTTLMLIFLAIAGIIAYAPKP